MERPNVLFLVLDSARIDYLQAHAETFRTLAADNLSFSRAVRHLQPPTAYRRLLFGSSVEVVLAVLAFVALVTHLLVFDPATGGSLVGTLFGPIVGAGIFLLGVPTAFDLSLNGVGALAYWLLCESTPVAPDDAQAIRTGKLRPPETLSAVPSSVEPVRERALATDPMERYGSVQALHTELAKLL